MVGWDHMAAGMEVDVAGGLEMPRTFGSVVTCRMALQRCGTKVLSWNVAGDVFLSLVSSVGDLKPGMTDFFHVGELILRPQLTDDLNDFMSASAAHMTVTNTWMNTHTELELPTVPVVWFNTALCEDIDKTIVQKLWMLEQMDCGRAGLVQEEHKNQNESR